MSYRIIVAHPERQHSFKLASALKRNGILFKYITTVYDKDSSLLMRLIKPFLSKENLQRATGRKNPDLLEEDVIQFYELRGLIQIALYRYNKSKRFYNWWHKITAHRFGKKVALFAIRNKADAVIMYDANATTCFRVLERKAPNIIRILDTSAANRLFMKEIYETDMEKCPIFAHKLKTERDFLWRGDYCALLEEELRKTQYFLVPSNFVKKSLTYSKIEDNQIKLCPYGTNFDVQEITKEKANKKGSAQKAVYVGNVTEMKGVFYLLEAIMRFPKEKLELALVGAFDNSDHVFDKYIGRVDFLGRVTHERVQEILKETDFFVFPSLGEGMSLAVLEAMSCGLPCIVTENSGVSDIVVDGKSGFIVRAQDENELFDKMLWFVNNSDLIPQMGRNAFERSKVYSWENYDHRLLEIINELM